MLIFNIGVSLALIGLLILVGVKWTTKEIANDYFYMIVKDNEPYADVVWEILSEYSESKAKKIIDELNQKLIEHEKLKP